MDGARKIAIKILKEVLYKNSYSNIALGKELNECNINDKDKALVTEIVYGTLKYKSTIDTILNHYIKSGLDKLEIDILNILRISIYQIRYLDKVPNFAVVNEAVELAKRKAFRMTKLVNAVLRNYIRSNNEQYYDKNNIVEKWCFEYSFPKWIVDLFNVQYGKEETLKILKGLNEIPAVTVRINNIKTNYEEVWQKLLQNDYCIEEGTVCPEAIIINKGKSIENNPLFREGLITVQDESAMMVAPLMDLDENMTLLDLCSAPGGKTCHAAEIMNNTGKIYALDIHEKKLPLIKENAKRLGITNISYGVLDASKYVDAYEEKADRVLIDVPCSGLGIIRKKPEIKWNKDKISIRELIKIQRKIMLNAAKYVKNNGKLIYATCTLNKEENEENIKWFMKRRTDFKLEPIYYGNLDNIIYHDEGYITVMPNKYMDGFFIAKMIKR